MRKILVICFVLCFSILYAESTWQGLTNPNKTDMRYFLQSGFTFEAVLLTAIFSYRSESPVIAECEFDVKFNDKVMIPQGAKLIGTCQITKNADRVSVNFDKLTFPNGEEIAISARALSLDGSAGISGKIKNKNKKGVLPAKVMLTSAGIAASTATQDIFAGEMIQELSQDMSKEIDEKIFYSISVPKGKEILVFITDRVEY